MEAAGLLPGREQPLRDGDRGRAPLGPDRPLEEGRGLRDPRHAGRRHGRGRRARGGRRGDAGGARGGPPDADRGRHLPLPRPLRRRPRGLPRARGGRGVARERPDRELRPALRRGRGARRARGAAGARRGRADRGRGGRVRRGLAGAAARHDVREPLRADDDPGGWYAVDERSPEPHRGEREDRMPDAAARAGRGGRRLRRAAGRPAAAEPGAAGRRPGRGRVAGLGRARGRRRGRADRRPEQAINTEEAGG